MEPALAPVSRSRLADDLAQRITRMIQAGRLREVLPVLVMYHQWATETDHRFMVSIGDNWIRFDDKPIARVIRGEPATL